MCAFPLDTATRADVCSLLFLSRASHLLAGFHSFRPLDARPHRKLGSCVSARVSQSLARGGEVLAERINVERGDTLPGAPPRIFDFDPDAVPPFVPRQICPAGNARCLVRFAFPRK